MDASGWLALVVLQVRAMYSLVKSAISHDERHYSLHLPGT
jgi:hypothetical protein